MEDSTYNRSVIHLCKQNIPRILGYIINGLKT